MGRHRRAADRRPRAERGVIPYPTAEQLRGTDGPYRRRPASERLAKSYVIEPNGCWRWTKGKTTVGYGHISIRQVYFQAHRLMYILHRGPVATDHIDHLCRNRWCVNPWHLEPVSAAVNIQRGLTAKLTAERVAFIRDAHAKGHGQRALARMLGIDHSTISRIVNGQRWKPEPIAKEGEAA